MRTPHVIALVSLLLPFAGCGGTIGRGHGSDGDGHNHDGGSGGMCSPKEPPVCVGTDLKTCLPDGTGYTFTGCPGGCMNGACVCAVGQRTCSGMTVQVCGSDGAYHDDTTCLPGTVCNGGLCDDIRCADEMTGGGGGEFGLPTNAWPRFRHDNRNSGWSSVAVADMPKLKWKAGPYGTMTLNPGTGGMASGPVVNQNNIVFIGAGDGDGKNGQFYSLDPGGKVAWAFPGSRGYGYSTPAVRTDGTSYFSSQDANAYAVSPTGTQVYKFPFGIQDDCSPIVTSVGNIVYGSDNGQLFALDYTGKLLWQSDPSTGPGEVDAALAQTCDGIVYAGGANGWTALDAKTGVTQWKVPTTGGFNALMSSPTVAFDGTMYGVDSGGMGYAISRAGKVAWSRVIGPGGAGTSVAKVGNLVIALMNDGKLHAVDAATGADRWTADAHNPQETYKNGGPVVDGRQRLYVDSNDGHVYCFDIQGRQLWSLPTSGMNTPGGNGLGEIAIGNDGTLYVPGNDGMLYAFQ